MTSKDSNFLLRELTVVPPKRAGPQDTGSHRDALAGYRVGDTGTDKVETISSSLKVD